MLIGLLRKFDKCLLALLVVFASRVHAQSPPVSSVLLGVQKQYAASDVIQKALLQLNVDIGAVYPKIPVDLREEFNVALEKRLDALLSSVGGYNSDDYRVIVLASGLLDLGNNVRELQYRSIGQTADQRHKATDQYTDLLAYGNGRLGQEKDLLDETVHDLFQQCFTSAFSGAQTDLFAHGFGEPLSDEQYSNAISLIDAAIDEAVEFSSVHGGKGLPPARLREIARAASITNDKLLEVVRQHSAEALVNAEAASALEARSIAIGSLQAVIDEQRLKSEQKEVRAIVQASEQRAKAFVDQANSGTLPPQGSSAFGAESAPPVAQDKSYSPTRFILVAINVAILVVLLVVVFRQKK
jgi:hypothetical protein